MRECKEYGLAPIMMPADCRCSRLRSGTMIEFHPGKNVDRSVHTHAVRMLLSLYLGEASALLILIGIYKAPVYDWTLLSTKAGAALIAGAIGLMASGWLLARQCAASGLWRRRALILGLTTNLLTLLLAFLLMESTVRILVRRTPAGVVVGSVTVRPTWSELTAKSREVLAGVAPWGTWDSSYFVYDRELGWTVGPNRRSPDGLYYSSVEGIRSAGPNERMADQTPRYRVALIGDSNAFSFEVPFEDSWGYHLQRALGADVQVLNFGVDGYGIDQTYLRFQRDVRPWKPRVVLIGFAGHDLSRSMAVYPFVSLGWPGYLVKPRFALDNGGLKLLNVPLPSPDEVLGAGRIDQLPFARYDPGDRSAVDWWFDRGPLLVRFLTSVSPRWPGEDPRMTEEAIKALNGRLFVQLARSIEESGAVALLVHMSPRNSLVSDTLARAGVPFLEATDCLAEVPVDRRRVASGHHYTGLANLAIARCTAPAVALGLGKTGIARP